tara:strand:+ start:2857 stop:3603 length:747 start_codon:yes stop_codon:yes gene_type:complete
MTQDGYLLRGLIFLLAFSIPTYGLAKSFGGIEFDLNWVSYFVNVGTIFFAGVFCVGRANRYLLMTFVSIVFVSYASIMILDIVLPLSGYLRVNMFFLVTCLGYFMLIRRNALTMKLNKLKNSSKGGIAKKVLGTLFKQDLPTRETNMSLMMVSFAKVYIVVDFIYAGSSVIYFNYVGMDFWELYGTLLATGEHFDFGYYRDMAILTVDVLLSICLITNVLYDGRRPDTLGVGKHATYDAMQLRKLHLK